MNQDVHLHANRQLWNTRTPLHLRSDFYDVEGFKNGKSSLTGIEIEQMGDVQGKSILHLQCHFGLDSLSLARLGASVTGVDFSDEAIAAAKSLANELKIPVRFLCHDVLELPDHCDEQFDIVYTSFGVLGWLPDLNRWSQIVRHFLKPGGFLYLLEFHSVFNQYDEQGVLTYDYFHSTVPDEETATKSYTGIETHAPLKSYWWNHTISDIVNAMLRADLKIACFEEFAYSPYKLGEKMIEAAPGRWVYENLGDRIPYMFSVKALN